MKTEYIDGQIEIGKKYSYKLKSKSISAVFSEYSDSLSYTLIEAIRSDRMTPNGLTDTLSEDRALTWNNIYINVTVDYTLTVLTDNNELVLRLVLQPTNYFQGDEIFRIPQAISMAPGASYKWRVDQNAEYSEGNETSGSESRWVNFKYIGS